MHPATERPAPLLPSFPMTSISRRHELEAALAALPENVVGEILFGRLVTQPRPALLHAKASSVLGALLLPPFQLRRGGPGGWMIFFEPEIALGPHVVVPDLAGWRVESPSDFPLVARTDIPPDWACEVLSPSTRTLDRSEKMLVYGACDVRHVWLVDPAARCIEVFESEHGTWSCASKVEGDATVRLAPFEAVELALADIWT